MNNDSSVRRALLPEVLSTADVANALGMSVRTAGRLIRDGQCGPWIRMGRTIYLTRDSFLEAIERRASNSAGLPTPPVRPPCFDKRSRTEKGGTSREV